MKKLFLLFVFFLFPIVTNAMSAESAIVIDADSGRVLYEHNAEKKKLIASTTKIMTALVALEYGDIDSNVTISEDVLKAYGSAIYIEVGEELTLKDLLYGLMLRSGNDAAIEIARSVAGSMESFVYLMNERAKEIGMKNTVFLNAHGLEESNGNGNTSTAYDMALLMREAMKKDTFREIVHTKNITVKSSYKTYVWNNKNRLLNEYEYTTGGKTGYTEKAKRTLVTSATKDGKNLIVVTLNDGNDFADHKSLYETYFAKYELLEILNKDNFSVEDRSNYKEDELFIKKNYNMLVLPEEKDKVRINVKLDKIEEYEDGEIVGKVEVLLKDKSIYEANVYVRKTKQEETKLKWWQKVLRWIWPW